MMDADTYGPGWTSDLDGIFQPATRARCALDCESAGRALAGLMRGTSAPRCPADPHMRSARRRGMIFRGDLRALTNTLLATLKIAAEAKDEQEAAFGAVTAVADFVVDLTRLNARDNARLADPLLAVAQALASACDGIRDPLLAPKNARKGVRVRDLYARAEAAGVMNVLQLSGMSERDAAAAVARALFKAPLMQGLRGQPSTAIMNWRKELLAEAEHRLTLPPGQRVTWRRSAATAYNHVSRLGQHALEAPGASALAVRKRFLDQLARKHIRRAD
jgi:hypothetical protein